MDSLQIFILLLGCWTVGSAPSSHSVSFSMVFSTGTRLLVHIEKDLMDQDEDVDSHPLRNKSADLSIQILMSTQHSQDPESPRLLVCLLRGLKSPQQPVLWWLNGSAVTSAGVKGSWTKSDRGYSAISVWEVSAADWRPRSSYWCGTIQDGHEYRQKLCSQN